MEDSRGTVERVGGYRVVRRLATGGTSDVLLAKAEGPHGFERTVVLKLLLSQYRNDEQFAKMFAREAAAYARLSHPAIVQLYDFFQLDGQLVMVLEFVDGAPLSRLRGMLKTVGQVIDDRAAIFVAQRIFSALAAAHDASGEGGVPTPVIHRDVNPSNVLVPWDGQVKLADFGIAKVTGVTHESAAGIIKGTYGYMAPEQVEGGAVTPRADVYAAGIILWELLTRRRAFQRGALPEIEVLRAMAEPRITSIDVLRPDVDKHVREALARALQPRADRRNITAEEMVAILREIVPPEEGRERLAELLSLVRHEPRPAATSAPPPMEIVRAAPPPPKQPPKLPPRPPSVPRTPAARVQPPQPPKRTASGALAATPPSSRGLPSSRPEVGVFDSLVEPPELVQATGRDSERLRLGTPLEALAPGLTLKDAIDEILSGVPSSIPPNVLPSKEPSVAPETSRMMGNIPPPPPPLAVTAPLASGGEFRDAVREIERAEQPTIAPAKNEHEETTTRSPAVGAPPFPALDRTLAVDPRIATAPIPAYTPPAAAPPSPPPPLVAPPARVPEAFSAAPSPPRARSRAGVFLLLGALVVGAAVAAVVGLTVLRRPKPAAESRASAAPPSATAPITPPATAAASASAPAPAAASASSSASASATASAAVPPASAAPAASEDAPAIPPGMGVVQTTGAIANRRIFVDERTMGQTPESVTVKCGTHVVRLGSSGKNQSIEVPCGGEVLVRDR